MRGSPSSRGVSKRNELRGVRPAPGPALANSRCVLNIEKSRHGIRGESVDSNSRGDNRERCQQQLPGARATTWLAVAKPMVKAATSTIWPGLGEVTREPSRKGDPSDADPHRNDQRAACRTSGAPAVHLAWTTRTGSAGSPPANSRETVCQRSLVGRMSSTPPSCCPTLERSCDSTNTMW